MPEALQTNRLSSVCFYSNKVSRFSFVTKSIQHCEEDATIATGNLVEETTAITNRNQETLYYNENRAQKALAINKCIIARWTSGSSGAPRT